MARRDFAVAICDNADMSDHHVGAFITIGAAIFASMAGGAIAIFAAIRSVQPASAKTRL